MEILLATNTEFDEHSIAVELRDRGRELHQRYVVYILTDGTEGSGVYTPSIARALEVYFDKVLAVLHNNREYITRKILDQG